MNKKIRFLLLVAVMVFGLFGSVQPASAANKTTKTAASSKAKKTGWQTSGKYKLYYTSSGKLVTGWRKIGKSLYYFRKKASGAAPKGSMVTGFNSIGGKTFYFSSKGVLQTGWKTINKKNYYFTKTGKNGTIGAMYVGLKKIGKDIFYFQEDGSAAVGWTTYKNYRYYFSNSTKLGLRGRALTGWRNLGKYRYYFGSNGRMQKNRWISNKYYVDKDGHMLKSCVTPDGYMVNASGQKLKLANGWVKQDGKYYYYVKGKKTVGWKTIGDKKYYFDESGVRQDDMTQTVEKANVSILLIAGHGQGTSLDPGATAKYGNTLYEEYKYTRQFATLIYNNLKAVGGKLTVTMYDQNYDCYQVNREYQAKPSKTIGPLPNWTDYDYVLEVHFNATATASKDLKGDKKYKGVGIYVHTTKTNVEIEKKIVAQVSKATGFPIWGRGTGVFKSDLLNARSCQELGVSYGLLETAFIDDKDDMTFYNANKAAMAKAVSDAIRAHFGV